MELANEQIVDLVAALVKGALSGKDVAIADKDCVIAELNLAIVRVRERWGHEIAEITKAHLPDCRRCEIERLSAVSDEARASVEKLCADLRADAVEA
jgi:hypothetical protein